jgi:hypothetical protein
MTVGIIELSLIFCSGNYEAVWTTIPNARTFCAAHVFVLPTCGERVSDASGRFIEDGILLVLDYLLLTLYNKEAIPL